MISTSYTGEIYDATASTTTKTTGTESGMGQDAFLKMFMAQMTNQNPLDPMDNTDFTAQLAQFSSLEQLTKISTALEGLDDIKSTMVEGQVLNYLGKEITLTGNAVPVSNGEAGDIGFSLASSAEVQMLITDSDGTIIADVDLGRLTAGSHHINWDATDLAGQTVADGLYAVTINATDANGDDVAVSNLQVTGIVTGYSKDTEGNYHLLVGDVAIPMENVLTVRMPRGSDEEESSESETEG